MVLTRTPAYLIIVGLTISLLVTGCDRPPKSPKNSEGDRVEILSVAEDNEAELKAATDLETARVDYRYRLTVLQGYYEKVGNMDKLIWTQREMKNLDCVQTFAWVGLPQVTPPPGESLEGVDERTLVEYVVAARQEYKKAMADLSGYYAGQQQVFKSQMVNNMQERFDPIRTYMYFLSAEIPPADLKPTAVIPEADALFADALRLHKHGKGLFPGLTSYPKQRAALVKFRELIEAHPTSNKISESAYYIAEIYKEYFNENVRAVHWYERAWQWDPTLPKPARFQAAVVHDIRLHNYRKAIECYRGAIKHEQFNPSNVRYSHQRIRELTGK